MRVHLQILYILGSTRSGTSALRNAIVETRFAGYGEGHLEKILKKVLQSVREAKQNEEGYDIAGTALEALQAHVLIRHFFHGYESYLVEEIKSSFIVDKTPNVEVIRLAPDLNRFHKAPKFIHCARRHVDNVLSKQKKFEGKTVEEHAREWAGCNLAWIEARNNMHGNYVEFDYHDLVNSTQRIVELIGTYLELDEEETRALSAYISVKRPEADSKRNVKEFVKLSQTPWTDEERDKFISICGPVGEKLGYGMESYFE